MCVIVPEIVGPFLPLAFQIRDPEFSPDRQVEI